MCTFNPDYPSATSGSFLQHTYQPMQQNDLYFYPGNGMMSTPYAYGGMVPQNDSRRNVMNPVNPTGFNPFNQFGQTQSPLSSESNIQPFSSYPPATPMGNQPQMGLNAMVESRRNMPTAQVQSTNPWAKPQQPAQSNPFQPQPQPVQFNGWFDSTYPGYRVDMNSMALYGDTSCGFDKHQSWDNFYTQTRPISMPNIDWASQQMSAQACYSQPIPQYPMQYPSAQANWKEIAEKNWASSNL